MNHWRIKQAAVTVRRGGVIAYPTEAVWGVGCDPFNRTAVQRLLQLKQRPQHKGLILVAAGVDQFEPLFAPLHESQRQQLLDSWPGPNTWLLPDPDNLIPRWVKGDHNSVAIRVTDHPQTKALCRAYGGVLVSTSANQATQPPALSAAEVRRAFGHQLDYLLPGALGGRKQPSVIRDLKTGQILR